MMLADQARTAQLHDQARATLTGIRVPRAATAEPLGSSLSGDAARSLAATAPSPAQDQGPVMAAPVRACLAPSSLLHRWD